MNGGTSFADFWALYKAAPIIDQIIVAGVNIAVIGFAIWLCENVGNIFNRWFR